MSIEDHTMTRQQARRLYLTATAEDEIAVSGNAAVARLRDNDSPLSDSLEQAVRAKLERVLRSAHFDGSARSRAFLRYVVEEVLAGRAAYLKQAAIAVEVFGRKPDFDAVIDPIVRVQAGRLRRSLERYYLLSGDVDSIRIELPKGSYAPVFVETTEASAPRITPSKRHTIGRLSWPTHSPFIPRATRHPRRSLRDELTAELGRYGIVRVVMAAGPSVAGLRRATRRVSSCMASRAT